MNGTKLIRDGTRRSAGGARRARANVRVEGLEPRHLLAVVADFELPDVNTGSPTYGELVSPRDYADQVSGWYFADAL